MPAAAADSSPTPRSPLAGVARSGRLLARSVWLPIAVYLAVRAIGVLFVARFAQLHGTGLGKALTVWDGKWMLALADRGYDRIPYSFTDANGIHTSDTAYAFFPGYPVIVGWVAKLPGVTVFGAAIGLNVIFGAGAAVAAYRLGSFAVRAIGNRRGWAAASLDPTAELDRSEDPAGLARMADRVGLLAVVFFAAAPMGVVLSMAYTEALYCMLAGWALVGVLEKRWLLAGFASLLAGLCRPTSVAIISVVILFALITLWRTDRGDSWWRPAVAILLAPLGWFGWILIVARHTGELGGWFRIQTEGWGTQVDYGVSTFKFVDAALVGSETVAEVTTAALILLSLIILAVAWWHWLPWPILLYGTLVLVSILASGGLMISRPRLMLPAFVLLIPIAMGAARLRNGSLFWVVAATVTASSWYGAHMITVYPHAM